MLRLGIRLFRLAIWDIAVDLTSGYLDLPSGYLCDLLLAARTRFFHADVLDLLLGPCDIRSN